MKRYLGLLLAILLALATMAAPAGARADKGPVARRAVVIGECSGQWGSYDSRNDQIGERLATTANLKGMKKLFGRYKVPCTVIKNGRSWNAILQKLLLTFSGADSDDVSYVYVQAHGGINWSDDFYMLIGSGSYNQSVVTATQLRAALDLVPGRKVVILESCHSGQSIGKGEKADRAMDLSCFVDAFRGAGTNAQGKTTLTGGEYAVICSTHAAAESWFFWNMPMAGKRRFTGGIFTYALARGAGWDLVSKKRVAAYADYDRNGAISMSELYYETNSTVEYVKQDLLDRYGYRFNTKQQTVCYPDAGSALANLTYVF